MEKLLISTIADFFVSVTFATVIALSDYSRFALHQPLFTAILVLWALLLVIAPVIIYTEWKPKPKEWLFRLKESMPGRKK